MATKQKLEKVFQDMATKLCKLQYEVETTRAALYKLAEEIEELEKEKKD